MKPSSKVAEPEAVAKRAEGLVRAPALAWLAEATVGSLLAWFGSVAAAALSGGQGGPARGLGAVGWLGDASTLPGARPGPAIRQAHHPQP